MVESNHAFLGALRTTCKTPATRLSQDRDQLEDVDLANHLLKEPVPKKIDDFRHHPLYILERHLKRHEMLMPTVVHVSALTSGKGMNLKTEKVYKRKDVVFCFSAREWFRRGRIIKV
jgi:xeroderma pigmentosum group C-complementing protein